MDAVQIPYGQNYFKMETATKITKMLQNKSLEVGIKHIRGIEMK